jgi:phage gp36-like protein
MTSPKLLSLLSVLDTKQHISLKKYLLSKVGKSSEPYKLYLYVFEFRLKPDEIASTEEIQKKLFPNSTTRAIQNNMSLLYNWTEEWVLLQQAKEEPYTHDIMLIKWFNKNGLYELADLTASQIEKNINENNKLDIDKCFAKFSLLYEQHFSNNPAKDQLKYSLETDLIQSFNEYVKAQYLILQCELSNWGSINHVNYQESVKNINGTLDTIASTNLTTIIEEIRKMVIDDSYDSLIKIKNRLLENEIREQSKLHYTMISYAINCASRFWDKGLHSEKSLINELVQYGLKSGFYFGSGKIQSAKFHNLVMYLSNNLEYEAVEKCIDEYIDKVSNTDLISTKLLARAQNSFYHHRYEEVEQFTRRNNFSTFNQKNVAQALHLMATFMNRHIEAHLFDTAMITSISFLKRNKDKMSPHLHESYNNLVRFIREVGKGNINIDIDEYKPLIYRSWCKYVLSRDKH